MNCVMCFTKDRQNQAGVYTFEGMSLCGKHLTQMWELRFVGPEKGPAENVENPFGDGPVKKPKKK